MNRWQASHRKTSPVVCPGLLCLALLLTPFVVAPHIAHAFTVDECALAGISKPAKLTAFLAKLRKAVRENDKDAVAAMVSFPVTIPLGASEIEVKDATDFVKHYDSIMTKELRDELANRKDDDVGFNRLGALLGSDSEKLVVATGDDKDVITIDFRGI